jgi:hypothetical protein
MRPFWLMLGALCLLVGCSAPGAPLPNIQPVVQPPAVNTPAPPQVAPKWLRIPAINVESDLIPVVLNDDGEIDVSELETLQAAW